MSVDNLYSHEFESQKKEFSQEDVVTDRPLLRDPEVEADCAQCGSLLSLRDNSSIPLSAILPVSYSLAQAEEEEDPDDADYVFESWSAEEIPGFMAECSRFVAEVTGIPAATARILLGRFGWDKDRLMERFYEGDSDELLSECRAVKPRREESPPPVVTEKSSETCAICLDNPDGAFEGLGCGHEFCTPCWRDYVTAKIAEEGMGPTISCPAHGCDALVDDDMITGLIATDLEVMAKYRRLIADAFVESNRLLRWCPTPDCRHLVRVEYPAARPVRCGPCGRRFCFGCGEAAHTPVECAWRRKWLERYDEDGETYAWIAEKTKDCPACHVPIEKAGGDKVMVCSCGHAFCWACLAPYVSSHTRLNCAPNEDPSRARLRRYVSYYRSYAEDARGLRFERRLRARVRATEEEERPEPAAEAVAAADVVRRFLRRAVEVLCQCHATLTWTCAFAFYLEESSNDAVIFEGNLADLAKVAQFLGEQLEYLLSLQVDALKVTTGEKVKLIVSSICRDLLYCESRRKTLLRHAHEGYTKDRWEYSEPGLRKA